MIEEARRTDGTPVAGIRVDAETGFALIATAQTPPDAFVREINSRKPAQLREALIELHAALRESGFNLSQEECMKLKSGRPGQTADEDTPERKRWMEMPAGTERARYLADNMEAILGAAPAPAQRPQAILAQYKALPPGEERRAFRAKHAGTLEQLTSTAKEGGPVTSGERAIWEKYKAMKSGAERLKFSKKHAATLMRVAEKFGKTKKQQ